MTTTSTATFLIGIDIGNTNIKCLALSAAGDTAIAEAAPTPRPAGSTSWAGAGLEMDPVWRVVAKLIRRTIARISRDEPGFRVAGVAVTSAGAAGVLLDQNGIQLPAGSVNASESALFQRYRRAMADAEYFATTGYPFEPGSTAFVLGAVAEFEPDRFARLAVVLSIADYVNFRLTGEFVREPSLGGSMGLHDVRAGEPWADIVDALGLEPEQRGRPLRSGAEIGAVTARALEATGLPPGTRVFAGGHDYLCAALATGCWDESSILDVLGTYEIIAAFRSEPATTIDLRGQRAFVDTHVVPGSYSLMIEALSSGRLEWLASEFLAGGDRSAPIPCAELFPEIDSETRHDLDPHRALFVPVLPVRDSEDALLRLSSGRTRQDVLRTLVEGLCFGTKSAFDFLATAPGAGPFQIKAVGGGSRSRFWVQTKADILGREIEVPLVPEATAAGAALLAGLGSGVYPDFTDAASACARFGSQTFIPDRRRNEFFEELYARVFLPARAYLEQGAPDSIIRAGSMRKGDK